MLNLFLLAVSSCFIVTSADLEFNCNLVQVVSSVVYVENAEAKTIFQTMKRRLAEDNRDSKEV